MQAKTDRFLVDGTSALKTSADEHQARIIDFPGISEQNALQARQRKVATTRKPQGYRRDQHLASRTQCGSRRYRCEPRRFTPTESAVLVLLVGVISIIVGLL